MKRRGDSQSRCVFASPMGFFRSKKSAKADVRARILLRCTETKTAQVFVPQQRCPTASLLEKPGPFEEQVF